MLRAELLFATLLFSISCATQSGMRRELLKRATFDLSCDEAKLEAIELSSRVFGVSGCDKRATYIVRGDGINGYQVILNSPGKQ